MDRRDEPERIEIELTPHDPATAGRARRFPPDAAVEVTAPDDVGGPGPLGSERRRLVAVGGAAAVTALLVGILVGRMGSGEVATTEDASTTTTVVTTTAPTEPTDELDTLPRAPELPTPTTRPESTTTTTVTPEQVKGVIDIDPAVPRDPIEVVVMTQRGDVTRIDVASGTTVTTRVEGSQFGPPTLFAGDGWVLVPSFDESNGSTVIADDGSRTSIDLGPWWPPLATGGRATFWRAEMDNSTGLPQRFVEVAIDGSETGVVVELDGFYPVMTDPLGGIVVQATGGFYLFGPEARTRFTSGRLIALGAGRALVEECDDQLDCGYYVVDRVSGARTLLDVGRISGGAPAIESGGWWSLRDAMSADEEAVLVVRVDQDRSGRPTTGVLDLTSGEYTEIGAFVDSPQMAWAPDGSRVYWLDSGRLMVFDPSTGESVLFSEELGTLNAMTLRPTSGPEETG